MRPARDPRWCPRPWSLPNPSPVLLAEIVKLFHPRLVDLHNYVPTCNTQQKLNNWHTLGRQAASPSLVLPGP